MHHRTKGCDCLSAPYSFASFSWNRFEYLRQHTHFILRLIHLGSLVNIKYEELPMPESPLKQELGNLLRMELKNRGIKQIQLAQALKITQSAVSQMLHGRTAPSMMQLDIVADVLKCNRAAIFRMQKLLAHIRTGNCIISSIFNETLRKYRKLRNYTSAELSKLSGIGLDELYELENNSFARPTPEQLDMLASALNTTLENLTCEKESFYDQAGTSQPYIVAEKPATAIYTASTIPVVESDALLEYESVIEPLQDFIAAASKYSIKNFNNGPKQNIFALQMSNNNDAKFLPLQSLLLIAGMEFPDQNDWVIAKLRNPNKIVIRQYKRDSNIILLAPITADQERYEWNCKQKTGYAEWIWPVAEIIIRSCERIYEKQH